MAIKNLLRIFVFVFVVCAIAIPSLADARGRRTGRHSYSYGGGGYSSSLVSPVYPSSTVESSIEKQAKKKKKPKKKVMIPSTGEACFCAQSRACAPNGGKLYCIDGSGRKVLF